MFYYFPGDIEYLEFAKGKKRKPMSAATKRKISLALKGIGGASAVGGIIGTGLYLKNKKNKSKNFDQSYRTMPPDGEYSIPTRNNNNNPVDKEFEDLRNLIRKTKNYNIASTKSHLEAKKYRDQKNRPYDLANRKTARNAKFEALNYLDQIAGKRVKRIKRKPKLS